MVLGLDRQIKQCKKESIADLVLVRLCRGGVSHSLTLQNVISFYQQIKTKYVISKYRTDYT